MEGGALWVALSELMGRVQLIRVMEAESDPRAAWALPDTKLAMVAEPDPAPDPDPEQARRDLAAARRRRRALAGALATGRSDALAAAARHLERLKAAGGRLVWWGHPACPDRLRDMPDPPAVLYLLGPLSLEPGPAVAIVGSRKPTAYGLGMADRLARDLVRAGIVIVSGMALGVDSAAHRAALDGGGTTIAVLGTGVDVPYPRHELPLYRRIAERGLVVSEHPPGTPGLPEHFPDRNRLISGLSQVTVVVEGTHKSGARHTANSASAQGKTVCAVPGQVSSPLAELPHDLIRTGATLVRCAKDVLDLVSEPGLRPTEPPHPDGSDDAAVILGWLGAGTHTAARLADGLGLPAERVAATLTVLELRGLVRQLPGGWFLRT